jgi:hypothetical protein
MVLLTEKERLGYRTVADLSRATGVSYRTLSNRIGLGQLPGPRHRLVGGRRLYYTQNEMEQILRQYARS